MLDLIKPGRVMQLKSFIDYQEGQIAHLDVIETDQVKFMIRAFDAGCVVPPHTAPGNALVMALEGKATITYAGQDYELTAGQCIRFEKGGVHSVKAQTPYKMAVLLIKG